MDSDYDDLNENDNECNSIITLDEEEQHERYLWREVNKLPEDCKILTDSNYLKRYA